MRGWARRGQARALPWRLSRGRTTERVALVEVPVEERAPILREFTRQLPHRVAYFHRTLGLPDLPDAFAPAAARCPVSRVDPLPDEGAER